MRGSNVFLCVVGALLLLVVFGWFVGSCFAPCSWFGWLPLTEVPSRCLPSFGGPR